jgi:glutamyl-tRNA reductase
MYLVTVGLNHKSAPVEIREKLTFPEGFLQESLTQLKEYDAIQACIILSTCNRTEIYAAVLDVEKGLGAIRDFYSNRSNVESREMLNYLYTYTLYDSIKHLFRVASGLDSMILGETQILGQVKTSYQISCEYGATNPVLNTLFQRAISVGKRVRTETEIDRNAVSISYAAVELARQIFNGLNDKTILIVGAGKMSELTAKHLVANGVTKTLVANRSIEKAEALAEQFGGVAIPYENLMEHMAEADIVISATSATHYIIKEKDMAGVIKAREGKTIFLIDIAVPRDIDPMVSQVEGVKLYDIDDLQNVVDRNLNERKLEAVKAEEIVSDELEEFLQWHSMQFVTPTVKALKKRGEEIRQQEINLCFNKLQDLTEREKKIINGLTSSIINKILHDPVMQLKAYALTHQGHLYTEILQNLFNLEVEGQRPKFQRINQEAQHGHPSEHSHEDQPHAKVHEVSEQR